MSGRLYARNNSNHCSLVENMSFSQVSSSDSEILLASNQMQSSTNELNVKIVQKVKQSWGKDFRISCNCHGPRCRKGTCRT